MQLLSAIENYLSYLSLARAPTTTSWYSQRLRRLAEHIPRDTQLDAITLPDLTRALNAIAAAPRYQHHPCRAPQPSAHISHITRRGYIRAWRTAWRWWVATGATTTNPMQAIRPGAVPRRLPRRMAAADLAAMRHAARDSPRDALLLALLADTGARAGGVLGLRWDDRAGDTIILTEKGDNQRHAYISPATQTLWDAWRACAPAGPWVFAGRTPNAHLRVDSLGHILRRIARRAGVAGPYNAHAIRHAYAEAYLLADGDLQSLSQLMGHASVSTTGDIYAMLDGGALRRKSQRHATLGSDTLPK